MTRCSATKEVKTDYKIATFSRMLWCEKSLGHSGEHRSGMEMWDQ